ncbi:ABC transporter permease [Herbiconiux sp. SYSU D00978]|uniref:ABC transporter permease n=1 Tax=Herbiconiux sp. SYSU D00978 TaxID=2812562 RepID=UPI001A95EE34|nr:polyketide antibiotic transporter [Herbiconiux sp. SYSU D00978]
MIARLVLAQLRRDRWQLLFWAGGVALLAGSSAAAVGQEFGDERERAAIVAVAAANPAFLFLRGTPDGTGVDAVVFFQAFAFLAVLAGLMSTFLVVRHTRGDEDAGRAELVGATPAGRLPPLAAALITAAIADLLLGALTAAALVAGGLDPEGSALTGAALALIGLAFAGVAAVAAQLMPNSRGANGVAGAAVGLAYLVRGVGDALGTPSDDLLRVEPATATWFSPIGWGELVRPYTDADARPLLLALATALVLWLAAFALRARRDLGASLLRERPGRPRAGALLGSAPGLAWRLQLPTLVGWCVGAAVLGSFAGLLAPIVADAARENASLGELIARLVPGTRADAVGAFTAGILGMTSVLAAAAGAQAVMRSRAEEADGRAELLLSAPLGIRSWLTAQVGVAFASTAVVALVAGLAAGAGFVGVGEDGEWFGTGLAAALAHVPAALVVVGVVVLVFAVLPRLTVALGWAVLVLALVLGQLGDLLGIPDALQDVSPFRHSSALPVEELDRAATLVLLAVAALAAGAAVALVRRRDLAS